MGLPSTMYRFEVDVSDTDRGVYESFDLRIAKHPSETTPYMLTRLIAFALHVDEHVELSKSGLCDPEDPALFVKDLTGQFLRWIDIGHPSPERIHKASKRAKQVTIYTHKDPEQLLDAIGRARVHRVEDLEIWSIEPGLLDALGDEISRNNAWSVVLSGGELFVTAGENTHSGSLTAHRVSAGN